MTRSQESVVSIPVITFHDFLGISRILRPSKQHVNRQQQAALFFLDRNTHVRFCLERGNLFRACLSHLTPSPPSAPLLPLCTARGASTCIDYSSCTPPLSACLLVDEIQAPTLPSLLKARCIYQLALIQQHTPLLQNQVILQETEEKKRAREKKFTYIYII